ncbi:MAG: HNH endonuclease [Gammaproteobacteria bacterium CG_4_10_14_0_8_um_filter_38_16]|nr:MAG: HNH endonuclease [Gammaproteobacteria bacterium CG_4_10_14_0_8_um_filter_38_16]PJA04396.1 MAG: HNH endonuclease [Gammaproteobacteria bacterium CG_4_10_14_0_2_um_filter_38_22]PJB10183.1 MAG: HNH endonuclease [Gammaproteobacteria bacterium CG_4_9_14_3_um_filter_38_9]
MVALHDIHLMATANNWRLFMLRKADPAFLAFQTKIHARDSYTCGFCGFQAKENLETINLNGNYLDNKRENLATACGLCAQCFFLEAVGKSDFGGGVLIYLPEMRQNELNALCHVLFASMAYHLDTATHAKNIYRSLKMRAQLMEEKMGEGLSNPSQFGLMLIEASDQKKSTIQETISKTFRLLPNMARSSGEIMSWMKSGLHYFLEA